MAHLTERLFLSTLSLRRATGGQGERLPKTGISIHALLAESDIAAVCFKSSGTISIHALLAESDPKQKQHKGAYKIFLSTLSLRRATYCPQVQYRHHHKFLSTLSLRRATPASGLILRAFLYFYPRSPCGERLSFMLYDTSSLIFLSTLSLRRATLKPPIKAHREKNFYPRSPCGERPFSCFLVSCIDNFYPRSPCGERRVLEVTRNAHTDFYPRSPCGERQYQ